MEFYNSFPDSTGFSLRNIAKIGIVGNGNVAIDVARILGSPISRLEATDISSEALEILRESSLQEIDIYGRRGVVQAAMTVKELRYLCKVPGISVRVLEDEIIRSLSPGSIEEAMIGSVQTTQQERARKRLFDLIISLPREHNAEARVKINLRFLTSPERYETGRGIRLALTELKGLAYKQVARDSGKVVESRCDALVRSIGYHGINIEKELPFNDSEGTMENKGGWVQGNAYVAGWARTGPFGVIDTTMRSVFVRNI